MEDVQRGNRRYLRIVTTIRRVRSRLRPTAAAVDVLVAVLLAASVVVSAPGEKGIEPLAVVAGLVAAVTVALRRRNAVVAVIVTGASAVVADHTGGADLAVMPIAFVLNYYALGRRSASRGWTWVDVLVLGFPLPAIATNPSTASPGNPLIVDVLSVWVFFMVIPLVAGRVVGARATLNSALQANNERLEGEKRQRERQAATEERTRIARELHDVVAHSVSVMVIQTGAARRVAARDRAAAVEAMEAVERCGRDALLDLRRMIGVLRRDELDLTSDVSPGLAQLDRLADRARAAGMPVQVRVDGDPRPLPSALDLVTYRIVQEALTNAIKHAGPARARVVVAFGTDALELEVVDTGDGHGQDAVESGGQGLIGMQERLALYGGRLEAGHSPGGGFRVHALIPLIEEVPA